MSNVKEKTINWPGQSTKEYTHTIYPVGTAFNDVGGNYIFARESSPNKWSPVYIGQTSSFKDRFSDHHKADCVKRNGATHIHVHQNSSENARLAEERDLIARWNPVCNG